MKFSKVKDKLTGSGARRIWGDIGVIAAMVMVVMFAAYAVNGIYPFGNKSIARADMVQQSIPAGVYYVWDILHGRVSPYFSWNSGLGMNISGAVSLGAFLSPLNLLLFLSPRSYLCYFVNILIVLKMIGLACAMYFYLRKYKVDRIIPIIGGVLYAFSAATLIHYQITLVMEAAFLFPLVMIGLDRMYHNRGCAFFITSFALCMIGNVYTACIILAYVLFSSGIRTYFSKDLAPVEKKRWILRLGLSVLAGFLLSAVCSIPALYGIQEAPRSAKGSLLDTYLTALQEKWYQNDWRYVERMCVNLALPFACMTGCLFSGRMRPGKMLKRYKAQLLLLFGMFLSAFVPSIELLWHGGSCAGWPIRFFFIISFVCIDFAVLLWQDQESIRKKSPAPRTDKAVLGCACVAVSILASLIFVKVYHAYTGTEAYNTWEDGLICLMIEAVFLVIYLIHLKVYRDKSAILVFLCAELVATSVVCFSPNKDIMGAYDPIQLEAANNVTRSMKTEIKDFDRIKNTDYKVDLIEYSLIMGEESVSNFWHVINQSLQSNFGSLGYATNWTQMLDTGGTIFTDTLLHLQYNLSGRSLPEQMYTLCEQTKGYKDEEIGLYQNKLEMPFAIQTDTDELNTDGEYFSTQNSLFRAVTGSQEDLIADASADISNLTWQGSTGKGKKVLYFYGTNGTDQTVEINVNGSPVYIPTATSTENTQYPADFGNGLVCLGCFEDETVTVVFNSSADSSAFHLGWLDYDKLSQAVEDINAQNPEIVSLKQKNNGLRMTLKNVTKKNIFLPVSYDEGWVCKVNGENVQLKSVDGMVSVPAAEGTNDIVLKYSPKGRTQGMILSIITLFVCLAGWYIARTTKSEEHKWMTVLDAAAYEIFGIVYAVFIAFMFLVPMFYYLKQIFILFHE